LPPEGPRGKNPQKLKPLLKGNVLI